MKLGETGRIPDEQLEELRDEMGLDQPLVVQYVNWFSGLVQMDFGDSLIHEGRDILPYILRALPVTLQLAVYGLAFGLVMGISVGILSAVYRGTAIDLVARGIAVFGLAAPVFWVGLVLILYGSLWFGVSVTRSYVSFAEDPWVNTQIMIWPALILGLNLGAQIMRYTRSSMLEVMKQDYIRTASAKGLPGRIVLFRHGLRNAFIPVITLVGTQFAFLLSGSVVLEVLFRLPGLGRLTYEAILTRDYPAIQGAALLIGTFVVLINLLVDLAYGYLDPRVRYG